MENHSLRMRWLAAGAAWLLVLIAPPCIATERTWVFRGPFGGDALTLAAAPSDPSIMLVGTGSESLYRSSDSGATWIRADLVERFVMAAAFDPSDSSVAYAGTWFDLYKSLDGGITWTPASTGITDPPMVEIVVDPEVPGKLFAFTYFTLYVSHDAAQSWSPVTSGLDGERPTVLAFDPEDVEIVYLGTPAGLYRSLDGGVNWGLLPGSPTSFESVAVLPTLPRTLLVGRAAQIWRSIDGGVNWSLRLNQTEPVTMPALAVDPVEPMTVYAGGNGSAFRSIDGGDTWTELSTYLQRYAAKKFLILPQGIFAATDGGGVQQSEDGGATWVERNTGIPEVRVHQIAFDAMEPSKVWLASSQGIFHSQDGGTTWETRSEGMEASEILSITINPFNSDRLWAGGFGDISVPSMFQTLDRGEEWLNILLCGIRVPVITYDPLQAGVLYAVSEFGICKSTNGGTSWFDTSNGNHDFLNDFAFDPQVPDTLYTPWKKSTDGGATWTHSHSGLSGPPFRLQHHPQNSGIVYAASTDGVFVTTDGAATWNSISVGLPPIPFRSLAIDPNGQPTLVAGSEGEGVFLSQNGGASWASLGKGLETASVLALAIDPSYPTRVLAGTDGAGVFEVLLPGLFFAAGFEMGDLSEWTQQVP